MIEKVIFKKFREAENLELRIGKNLTIIAGQNGTMKSTLLACLAQPFGIERGKENSKNDLEKCKIINNTFKTKINDIFKLSENYDPPGKHEYEIYFTKTDDLIYENPLQVKSFRAKDRNPPIRFVTGKDRAAGKGNIPIPVVYLGLSRIYPLGESELSQKSTNLSKEEKEFIYKNYKEILLSYNEEYCDVSKISKNKNNNTIGISTLKYNWETISAGQDNVGKIISTILEFKRLKKILNKKYYGGIILIDELETTLYPKAQQKLVIFLNRQCQKLDLKIIFTTHSIEILKECIENESILKNVEINFLDKTRGKLINKNIISFDDIVKNLLVLPKKAPQKIPKISIYTEDNEGEWILKQILKNNIKKYIIIKPLGLGHAEITNINRAIDEIKEGIITYDKDVEEIYKNSRVNSSLRRKMDSENNFLFLPGKKSIEEDFIEILKEIPETDNKFWDNCKNDNRQLAMNNLGEYDIDNRNSRKEWFKNELKNYGRNGKEILNKWQNYYEKDIDEFQKQFQDLLEKKYLKKYGIKLELEK